MKRYISGAMSLVFLAGCVPTTAWYKGSVTQNRANQDLTTCQASAAKSIPTSIENKVTGGFFIGYVYIPTTSDVDTNNQLRSKVVAQCMTSKGFQAVELPLCTSNVPVPNLKKPAVITSKSCFKVIPGGYYAIAQKK